jgi:hypothetical protein
VWVDVLKAGRQLHKYDVPGIFFNMVFVLDSKNIAIALAITFDFPPTTGKKRK